MWVPQRTLSRGPSLCCTPLACGRSSEPHRNCVHLHMAVMGLRMAVRSIKRWQHFRQKKKWYFYAFKWHLGLGSHFTRSCFFVLPTVILSSAEAMGRHVASVVLRRAYKCMWASHVSVVLVILRSFCLSPLSTSLYSTSATLLGGTRLWILPAGLHNSICKSYQGHRNRLVFSAP